MSSELSLKAIAAHLSAQAAQLLGREAFVVDHEHRVIASSRKGWEGRTVRAKASTNILEVPVEIGGEYGWVVLGASTDGSSVPPHLVHALINFIIDQTAKVEALPQGPELKNKIIHDLLHGSGESESILVRQARLLGMDLEPPRAVILIDASNYLFAEGDGSSEKITELAQRVIDGVVAFFKLPTDTICAYIGEGEIAVLKASDTRNLSDWANEDDAASSSTWANLAALRRAAHALLGRLEALTGHELSIGISRYHRGPGGLSRSYADARAALTLGSRSRNGDRVHSLDRLGIAGFVGLSDAQTKLELAKHLLSPLDSDPELINTLDVYFRCNREATRTAQQLGIHRNSLAYRLEKVNLVTGLDPRVFDEAVQIRLALVLRSLEGEHDDRPERDADPAVAL